MPFCSQPIPVLALCPRRSVSADSFRKRQSPVQNNPQLSALSSPLTSSIQQLAAIKRIRRKTKQRTFLRLLRLLAAKRGLLLFHCWRVAGPATKTGGEPPPLHGCLDGGPRSKNAPPHPRITIVSHEDTKPRSLTGRREYQASSIQHPASSIQQLAAIKRIRRKTNQRIF
jgi:hypothetical protein